MGKPLCKFYYKCKVARKNRKLCRGESNTDYPRDGCAQYSIFILEDLQKREKNGKNRKKIQRYRGQIG